MSKTDGLFFPFSAVAHFSEGKNGRLFLGESVYPFLSKRLSVPFKVLIRSFQSVYLFLSKRLSVPFKKRENIE